MRMNATTRTRTSERGSTMTEMALVTPIFLLLIFGVMEFGFLLRNQLTINSAATESARAASVGGNDPDTDFLVLRTVEHGVASMGLQNIRQVVVYRASGPDTDVPTACLTAPVTATATAGCNRYTAADFFLPLLDSSGNATGNFRCDTTSVDRYWCPSDRTSSLLAAGGPDYVGVYIEANHDYVTGFFGASRIVRDQKVIRIEPERG
jgi:hypothetical protein